MTTKRNVLVSGATGNQGGAVAHALMAKGHHVIALTRNTESEAARILTSKGARVIQGDFNDVESVARALEGVDTFYLMGTPFEKGPEGEIEQGIALADAAKSSGVGHLVYSSVASADLDTGIPHFESKYKIEQYIQTLDIPYTISAPVFFMENVISPWYIDALKAGKIMQAMPAARPLQQISVKNIGDFAASLIERRNTVFGKRFDIAGDELTGLDMAGMITQKAGYQVQYESFPVSELEKQSKDMALMFEWFDKTGYSVDIEALKSMFADVNWQNYSAWAEEQNWKMLLDQ